jgi:energy-coupling factor transporter ATP-binding protein EcfA2
MSAGGSMAENSVTMARLQQAYRDLDYLQPLMPDDKRLARGLFEVALSAMTQELLLIRGQSRKLLLHGHVGCGKSTFLNCLQTNPDLASNFLVVPVYIKEVADPDDIDLIDLLLVMSTAALEMAISRDIDLSAEELPDINRLVRELRGMLNVESINDESRGGEIGIEGGASVPSIISWLRAGFLVNYKASHVNRRLVRETFAPRIGELIESTNHVFETIESKLGQNQRLLFLVHDTDKPVLKRALHLLEDQGYQLSQIRATAVMVVDKALACSGRFSVITTRLGAARPFPAFKIIEKENVESTTTQHHKKLLAQLLEKRLPVDLVEETAIDEIISLGGGHLRETLRIAREAVLKAVLRNSSIVDASDVDYAAIQRANEFNLTRRQWEILKEVSGNPHWCPEEDHQSVDSPESPFLVLLNSVALLEYTNAEEKWLRPHPVLKKRAQAR